MFSKILVSITCWLTFLSGNAPKGDFFIHESGASSRWINAELERIFCQKFQLKMCYIFFGSNKRVYWTTNILLMNFEYLVSTSMELRILTKNSNTKSNKPRVWNPWISSAWLFWTDLNDFRSWITWTQINKRLLYANQSFANMRFLMIIVCDRCMSPKTNENSGLPS